MVCHFLLPGISPTQSLNPHILCLLHYRWILYPQIIREGYLAHTKCLENAIFYIFFPITCLEKMPSHAGFVCCLSFILTPIIYRYGEMWQWACPWTLSVFLCAVIHLLVLCTSHNIVSKYSAQAVHSLLISSYWYEHAHTQQIPNECS